MPPFQEAGRPERLEQLPATRRLCLSAQRQDGRAWRLRCCTTATRLALTSRSRPATRRSSSSHLPMTAGPTSRRSRPTGGRCRPTTKRRRRCSEIPRRSTPEGNELRRNGAVPDARPPGVRRLRPNSSTCRRRSRRRSACSASSAASSAVTADYVYSKGTQEKDVVDNINLTFNPATGANFPFANRASRPYPDLGCGVDERPPRPLLLSRAADAVTKRYSDRWQGSATYTLSGSRCDYGRYTRDASSGISSQVTFDTAARPGRRVELLGRRPAPSGRVQRHLAGGLGLPGERLHFFAAGIRSGHNYGGDVRGFGRELQPAPASGRHDRSAQYDLIAPAQNRTDIRFQQRIPLGGRVAIRWDRGNVQHVQPPELGIGTRRARPHSFCSTVGAGAHDAVRVPPDVLGRPSSWQRGGSGPRASPPRAS